MKHQPHAQAWGSRVPNPHACAWGWYKSRPHGVHLVRIDPQVLDRLLDVRQLHLAAPGQLLERGNRHALAVDLEKSPERRSAFTAAETVRAHRGQPARNPASNRLGP